MKKQILILPLLLFVFLTFSGTSFASTKETLKKADELIEKKQYDTAFKLLNEADKKNKNKQITFKKIDIAMNYFASNINYSIFAFKDLDPHEDINELRGKEGSYTMYPFDVEKTLLSIIKKSPKDKKAQGLLGHFYFEVSNNYTGNWKESDSDIVEKGKKHLELAKKLGYKGVYLDFELGYFSTVTNENEKAAKLFESSIKKYPEHAPSHYNLAFVYANLNKKEDAIKHALHALDLYESPRLKSDAARVIAVMYFDLEDKENTLKYYEMADEIDPKNYYNLQSIIPLYVSLDELSKAQKKAIEFFSLAPKNPRIAQELIQYFSYNDNTFDRLLVVFSDLKKQYKKDKEVLGNIYFHETIVYSRVGQKDKALKSLKKSKKNFKKVLKKDHYVFKAIEESEKVLRGR